MRFPLALLGLSAQTPLLPPSFPTDPMATPRPFALKEGPDVFSPKDLVCRRLAY